MTQQGIEVFLAVGRLGSVSAAAQALYITQPAVSRHLRALEETLGCALVVRGRGRRQVELTDRGRTGRSRSTPPGWTWPPSCACPGIPSMTCGTPSGSARRRRPGRCWTRCPCWRSFFPGGTAGRTAGPLPLPWWPSPSPESWG
ncbi:MAG: LysR family transcriptional regulator [Lawsonibacter sp.]|nr:LysR family transcriptional regulator [Lawsonibacter sp.]